MTIDNSKHDHYKKTATPLCPLFGECGGCQYQDVLYEDELSIKENQLKELFQKELAVDETLFESIVRSPTEYHYRSRLDLKLLRTQQYGILMGFSPVRRYPLVQASACPIAIEAISAFLPELKKQAMEKLPPKYRNANLVVRTGDDGRVFWGGIGRRSLRMDEENYFWTQINDKKIFYSLDTFFQANLSILPSLISCLEGLDLFDENTLFYDLYGGVGLFGMALCDRVKKVVLVEENIYATKLAAYNVNYHQVKNFEIVTGTVEEKISSLTATDSINRHVAMIDPPRAGLSHEVVDVLTQTKHLNHLLYLSCQPESLVRDLSILTQKAWRITKIIPFDFFPKTKHLETLVVLTPQNE